MIKRDLKTVTLFHLSLVIYSILSQIINHPPPHSTGYSSLISFIMSDGSRSSSPVEGNEEDGSVTGLQIAGELAAGRKRVSSLRCIRR
jgi:hypothetical protein